MENVITKSLHHTLITFGDGGIRNIMKEVLLAVMRLLFCVEEE